MGNLAAGDVTYSGLKIKKLEDGRKIVHATIAFGDGVKTYPTGGVPITIGKLAVPSNVDSFSIDDNGKSGYEFSYDKTNKKLVMFGNGQHTHDVLLKNAAVADGATTRVNAGTNLLGANTGGDLTVAGGGANGGVKLSGLGTDSAQQEVANSIAPAAQTLKITVVGY